MVFSVGKEEGKCPMNQKEAYTVAAEPAVNVADDLAEASGCLHHPFIKVFGEAKWQEANVLPWESDVSGDLSGRTSLCSLPSPRLSLPTLRPSALPPLLPPEEKSAVGLFPSLASSSIRALGKSLQR